jgi:histidinol-phosphate/aromatic aminotransferase/cobyric acid decarboxylase-like protein
MTNVFVPPNHQIIAYMMGYFNSIGKNKKVIHVHGTIENNFMVPNYDHILKNINSLTRMIYLVGPLNKKSFDEFIKKVPFNIPIIVDFCWDGFIRSNDNIKMGDYLEIPNTIICINTFSKFYGLPGIHLSWSVSKKDIGIIISNYFHYPVNLYYEKVALEVLSNDKYLDSVRNFYSEERNKLAKILTNNKIKFYFELPNTLLIEKAIGIKPTKFDDDYEIKKFLTETNLIYYFRVSKEGSIIKIRLFMSKSKNNDELIYKILEIFK